MVVLCMCNQVLHMGAVIISVDQVEAPANHASIIISIIGNQKHQA